jgi:methylmalonyl-CoA epimerase
MARPRIDHVGIAVHSLEKALELYRDVLGFESEDAIEVPEEKVRMAMLTGGESRIELLEATSDDSPIAKFLAGRGEGIHHIALRVPALSAAVERLRAAGKRLVNDEIRTRPGGYRYVFLHPDSTGGVLLELIEE